MKALTLGKLFQILGLIFHFFMLVYLAAVGYFDVAGIQGMATTLLTQSIQSCMGNSDRLTAQITKGVAEFLSGHQSEMKALCNYTAITFVAHITSFTIGNQSNRGRGAKNNRGQTTIN